MVESLCIQTLTLLAVEVLQLLYVLCVMFCPSSKAKLDQVPPDGDGKAVRQLRGDGGLQ